MEKKNNILLAQKYKLNKNFDGKFYCVPNVKGRNVMVVKHNDITSLHMPHAVIEKTKSEIGVIVDHSFQGQWITDETVCSKVGNIECRFKDLEPIVIEVSEFFMNDVCYHGKLSYDEEKKKFKLFIYDILTYTEYKNKMGTTKYTDRRYILNMLYKHHNFETIEVPVAFYYGDNIKECDSLFDTMDIVYKGLDGYLIYKEDGIYKFGQTDSVLIKYKGDIID